MPPPGDGGFAAWLAQRTGELLLSLREELGFGDPGALRDAGDKRAHDLLLTELGRWRPADAVLSEEGVHDDPARLSSERVWIVDPLDGTREYGEPGRADWAVHVALWSRQTDSLVAGAISLPAQHRVLGTNPPPSYPPLHPDVAKGGPIRIAVSRTRPPAILDRLTDLPGNSAVERGETGRLPGKSGAEFVPMGSAGAKIAAVITGEVDAYVHAGGQFEWDSAAPVAVAVAAGLHASRVDGSPLRYNRPDPNLPDLIVCRADLAARLLSALSHDSHHG